MHVAAVGRVEKSGDEEEELWEVASGRKRENSSDRSRSDQTGSDRKRRSDGAVARSGTTERKKGLRIRLERLAVYTVV